MTNKNTKVLALKYRPQTFRDLIGQEVVAETIINSIKANKVPNAYLFTGIRGVGKTTIARIVAKLLNCQNGIENECKKKCVYSLFVSGIFHFYNFSISSYSRLDWLSTY